MPDPLLSLDPSQASVEPGGQTSVTVTIHNPGTIVEGYDLDIVTVQPVPWVQVVPPFVSVYPRQEQHAVVVFSPPSGSATTGGSLPFGVRARSRVDPSASVVVEGDLEIGRVFGLQTKLEPVTSTGRWRGRHTLQISNWGNSPVRLRLVPSDPDQSLGFLIRPETLDVPLGMTTMSRLKVRTRRPTLRGTPRRIPFQIVGEPDPPMPAAGPVPPGSDPRRPVVDGAFFQKPILSRLVVALAAALVLVAAGVTVATALTRPSTPRTFEELGRPDPPTSLQASAPTTTSVTLTWSAVDQIEGYQLLLIDPKTGRTDNVIALKPDVTEQQVQPLQPKTKYCFALQAVRGKLTSRPSNQACASTLAGKPTATQGTGGGPSSPATSTGGSSTGTTSTGTSSATTSTATTTTTSGTTEPTIPGQVTTVPSGSWVGAVASTPTGLPGAAQTVEGQLAQLAAQHIPAVIVKTSDFTGWTIPCSSDCWVVVVGPGDQATVQASCDGVPPGVPAGVFTCLGVFQLTPAG